MSDGTYKFIVWLVITLIIYGICAFTQWTLDITEWSTICRAIMAIGAVGIGYWIIVDDTK
jgi:hypothetical protein